MTNSIAENPNVQFHSHKGSPIIPILNCINPGPLCYLSYPGSRIDIYFRKIDSNIVLPSTPRPS